MLDTFTRETFAALSNVNFRVSDAPVNLELTQVTEGYTTARQRVFSLVFHGPADHFLPQQIHKLEHAQLGAFDLFLVPIGRDHAGFLYEAVFNQIAES